MPRKNVHYPHSTIESAGRSISGHADTLHTSASSASGITLPGHSLGSIGSSHANALQSHISGVSGHISTMAQREGGHGDTLVRNSAHMRDTDSEHANQFALIHLGPSRTNLGSSDARPVGDQSGIEQLQAGAHHFTPTPGLAAGKANRPPVVDPSIPTPPHQPPPGTTPVPGETHGHTTHGEYKPPVPGAGRRPRPMPGQAVGGHVAAGDVVGPPPAGTLPPPPRPPRPAVHGAGVHTGAAGVTVSPAAANGVYNVQNAPLAGVRPGAPGNNKPLSTMFPGGVNSGLVQNMGNQAWNHGNPSGGLHNPNPGGSGNTTWHGQAQVPYTPVWNPHNDPNLPPHGGTTPTSNPHAGEVVNVQGFHRPMDPTNPAVQHPATYFPEPPANQPPVPTHDPDWADTTPKRTYDDPGT
jgi:hypothetical protein